MYKDFIYRAARADADEEALFVLDALGVNTAISVPWRAGRSATWVGDAYGSRNPEASRERTPGSSTRQAWRPGSCGSPVRRRRTSSEPWSDFKRWTRLVSSCLKNASTAADKIRRRFASELHDDALQKLTAAELHLQRVSPNQLAPIDDAVGLLKQAEDALRKLLFEVRPPALELPGGFDETIRDRVMMLRQMTGIEAEVDLDLPDDVPYEIKSVVFRQVSEAVTNVEKHSAATRVMVKVKAEGGGISGW